MAANVTVHLVIPNRVKMHTPDACIYLSLQMRLVRINTL